ncbi:hypothetical protein [Floridanema aerugineum]|uniref:Ribosomal protein S18 n=1 Tax=Floridaenema aerugineum BLCC-F46 TaxID=3153654 RepID=A0ABV4X111_9CYAN
MIKQIGNLCPKFNFKKRQARETIALPPQSFNQSAIALILKTTKIHIKQQTYRL